MLQHRGVVVMPPIPRIAERGLVKLTRPEHREESLYRTVADCDLMTDL